MRDPVSMDVEVGGPVMNFMARTGGSMQRLLARRLVFLFFRTAVWSIAMNRLGKWLGPMVPFLAHHGCACLRRRPYGMVDQGLP